MDYLGHGEYRRLARRAAAFVYSESVSVVVRKDLSGDPRASEGERRTRIRAASLPDVQSLLGADGNDDVDADELWERRLRQHIAATLGVDGCYVADVAGVGPSFMQYLFTSDDNERLRSNFAGLFPILAVDEAMVEFLYVAPGSRNPGFIVDGLVQVADEARRRKAASVISFIDPTNTGALFVNHLAGFQAHSVRRSRKRFLRRTYSFEAWPTDVSRKLTDVARAGAGILSGPVR
jgi:hypothetical protein